MRFRGLLMIALLTFAPLFGGGAWISFINAQAIRDPFASGAITIIRLIRLDGKTLDSPPQ